MTRKINLIFMGGFTYPYGMAATKRIQNIINALKETPDVEMQVILQRQSSEENELSGVHKGISYETVMGDLFRTKLFFLLPILYFKTILILKRAFRSDQKNVIYFYGPLFIDNIVPLISAKWIGYKIVFDVVEDFGLAKEISHSFYHYARSKFANNLSLQIKRLASGIIVISSYLEVQCRQLMQDRAPLHYMSVSVDMNLFPEKTEQANPGRTFFYAGNFSKKDGVMVLLESFNKLARQYDDIRLVLTGRGDSVAMKEFFTQIEKSPYRDRIEYKGYLNDEDYYSLLNQVDIPCMTRVDIAFANAGFPFKLGEYLATGKPVIASKVSDIERFLSYKQNAMLVQAGSCDEICKAAEFILTEPESARAIGKRGREIAKANFDNRQQGRDLVAFIQSL